MFPLNNLARTELTCMYEDKHTSFWSEMLSGASPTNGILIEFEIQWIFVMRWSMIYSADHNKTLHTSWQ